jgi:transposase
MGNAVRNEIILKMLGTLNEAQARWYVATEAISYGYGGVKEMHKITGMSPTTIIKGIKEVRSKRKLGYEGRVRKPGGGRKSLSQKDKTLSLSLHQLLEENTAGDPMTWLKWTTKSENKIADALTKQGHKISYRTVGRMLHAEGYTLQSNKKNVEGKSPSERDSQFRYINTSITNFMKKNQPVISVDTKKVERVGNFKNQGKTWQKKGNPKEVNIYDFEDLGIGKAIPYGTYDVLLNKGFVNVGISSDTAEFAVESIRQWWKQLGKKYYKRCKGLLICADSGGSNGKNRKGWKYHLQQFASETRLKITVCHLPPGTSKWNKIEHKLFSFISMNWKGEPLINYEVVINFIRSTATKTGLEVFARLDKKNYKKGREFTDEEMKTIKLKPHKLHPDWNYTILPQ